MKTCRRTLLDDLLALHVAEFRGKVLDVGGERRRSRSTPLTKHSAIVSWTYVNNDLATEPDVCCDAVGMPFADESFDAALLTEVLEHVADPLGVLKETARVLRSGGVLLVSMPFLFAVHADPYDFQRWTGCRHETTLIDLGFGAIQLIPMGGVCAVFHDLLHAAARRSKRRRVPTLLRGLARCLRPCVGTLDRLIGVNDFINTGYFVVATKNPG